MRLAASRWMQAWTAMKPVDAVALRFQEELSSKLPEPPFRLYARGDMV